MPKSDPYQYQTVRQEKIFSPEKIHSLELLSLPLMDLRTQLEHEIATNPVLEQEEEEPSETPENIEATDTELGTTEAEDLNGDELADIINLAESWRDNLPFNNRPVYDTDEEKRQHFLNSIVDLPSAKDMLLSQLAFLELSKKDKELVELIIGSIDDQGYFRGSLADLAVLCGADLEEMGGALKIVQGFDPPGIAARDLKESLLLQLDRQGKKNSKAYILVKNYLDDLANNRLPQIAENMEISMEKLEYIIAVIQRLNPYPCIGLPISRATPNFILPEAKIEEKNGEYVVDPKTEYRPRLKMSTRYLNLLEDPETPEETKNYIKQKILEGKNLIRNLDQRESTIQRITEVVVDTQHDFFKNGISRLKPLTMKEVADKLGLHETTVSRAVSGKYIETPRGSFELKFFFSTGYQSDSGDLFASRSIMEKIREVINEEDSSKPFSDEAIAQKLNQEGIHVARRTITKYREEMSIPSSRLRKKFT